MNGKEELNINDGGGIFDSAGFTDTIILDCNNTVKQLVGGNYIAFCNGMRGIVEKLAVLKNGTTKEKEDMQRQISELREQLEMERRGKDAAGSVYNTLDGTVDGREESLRDAILSTDSGLEPGQDHAGT